MKIKNPTTTIFFLIISVMVFFFFIKPKYQESTSLQASLSQIQAEYANRVGYYKRIMSVVSSVESRQDFLEKVNSALPENDSTSGIINFLQTEAKKNNLTVKSISFSKTTQSSTPGVKDINFNIALFGKYKDFKKMILALDSSARLFEINTMSFESELPSNDPSLNPEDLTEKYYELEISTHSY